MLCRQCGRDNQFGARFCVKCGAFLLETCPRCHHVLPGDADVHFCPACGSSLASPLLFPTAQIQPTHASVVEVDRRFVTVLFADLAGWTQLAMGLDPEDVRTVQQAFFAAVTPPIAAHGGSVEKYIGDAVVAVFGVPEVHEDDPERAVRAALGMQEALAALNTTLARTHGLQLAMRIGSHCGLVVAEHGQDRASFSISGDTTNYAFHLQEEAQPNTVLVSRELRRWIAHAFETVPVGPLHLYPGASAFDETAYRVLHAWPEAIKLRGVSGLDSPLVGRQSELAALQEALGRLDAGRGGIVTLSGDAGIGKSRLIAELKKLAPAACQWVEGRCLSYASATPYHLWLGLLRGVLGARLDEPPDAVAALLRGWVAAVCPDSQDAVFPYLGGVMALPLDDTTQNQLASLTAQELQQGIFAAAERIVGYAANRRPLVMICEDLHWADPSSLALLEHLLPLSERTPLLLICVFRTELEGSHPLWRIRNLDQQNHPQHHLDLQLGSLSAGESESLLTNLLGEAPPARLAWRILGQAEGNPFYVEEIIRSLIARGALAPDAATGHHALVHDFGEIAIPETLQSMLSARIDQLHAEERRVLQVASVIGRIFVPRLLAAMAGDVSDLDARLRALEQKELIRARPGGPEMEYIFKHALTQEAAYHGILRQQRQVFHRQAAEALERLFSQHNDELLGLLAYHWEHSDEPSRAIPALLQAGDRARLAYAHREAVDFYQRALHLLEQQGDDDAAARTLMRLGLVHTAAFDHDQASTAYAASFELWRPCPPRRPEQVLPPASQPHRRLWGIEPKDWDPNPTFDYEIPLFSGLLEETADLEAVPDVACRWELLDGGRTYVFQLRDDVRWSDSQPVTASDFEFAWKRLLDPAAAPMNARRRALDPSTGLRSADLLHDVRGARAYHLGETGNPNSVGVRAVDPLTLVVELEQPTACFLHIMAHPVAFPVPRHCVAQYGDAWCEADRIVGNGPFVLKRWHPKRRVDLARNPLYHGRYGGNAHEVELLCLPYPTDWSERLALYEQDQLDILYIGNWSAEEFETARQRHPGEVCRQEGMQTTALCLNVNRPPFDDVRVRQAVVHAVGRQGLVREIHGAAVDPATGGFVPPAMAGHSAQISLPFDPARARHLLAEAGYPNGRGFPKVEACSVMTPNTPLGMARWDQVLRETLNISLLWTAVDWSSYYQHLDRQPPHMGVLIWSADYPDPDNFLRVAYRHCQRHFGWRNAEYEGLIEDARQLADPAVRLRLYRQADAILVREAAIVPYLHNPAVHLIKPWVSCYPQSALGTLSMWTSLRDTVIAPHDMISDTAAYSPVE